MRNEPSMLANQLTAAQLEQLLLQIPLEFQEVCSTGHCDAFALALRQFLTDIGIVSTILVGSRFEYDEDDELIDETLLSHVVVDVFGTTWDASGKHACDAWESGWNTSHHRWPYNIFDWNSCTVAKLHALRKELDNREIDSTVVQKSLALLQA